MEFINGVTMRVHKHKSRQINIKNGVLAGTANLPTLHCQFADVALPICRHRTANLPTFKSPKSADFWRHYAGSRFSSKNG